LKKKAIYLHLLLKNFLPPSFYNRIEKYIKATYIIPCLIIANTINFLFHLICTIKSFKSFKETHYT